jgi:thiol-disulfide isomerase/thioredoxin
MKPKTILFILTAFFMPFVSAYAQIQVQKTDIAGVNKLMSADDGPRLMVMMASWCAPCRKELPELVKLYDKYRNHGLNIIGISIDEEGPSMIVPLLEKSKVNFPVYWVGEGAIEAYQLTGIPTLFLIKNGKIIERITGITSGDSLDKKLSELLR